MSNKTVNVSDLSGPALDWAVAKCEGIESFAFVERDVGQKRPLSRWCGVNVGPSGHERFCPSSDWSLAGPIIEREKIDTLAHLIHGQWVAVYVVPGEEPWEFRGPTLLIAAMRCYIASRLGDTVEIPEGLV